MAGLNRVRLLLGGLAAGVTMNVITLLAADLYFEEMMTILNAHQIAPPRGPAPFAVYLLMRFTWGFVAVWIYTAARGRYGPGPKTALLVGIIYWLGSALLAVISYGILGIFPVGMLVLWAVIMLVAIVLSTLVGAWIYREA